MQAILQVSSVSLRNSSTVTASSSGRVHSVVILIEVSTSSIRDSRMSLQCLFRMSSSPNFLYTVFMSGGGVVRRWSEGGQMVVRACLMTVCVLYMNALMTSLFRRGLMRTGDGFHMDIYVVKIW